MLAWSDYFSYLSENFKTIEIDRYTNQVQIRSYPPYQQNGQRFYFEIIMDFNAGIFKLYRVCADVNTNSTKKYPFVVSEETLQRLLADIISNFE